MRVNLRGALHNGRIDVYALGPNVSDIVGVATWYPPGQKSFPSEEIREKSGWNTFIKDFEPAHKDWWLNTYSTSSKNISRDALPPDFTLNAWSLQIFGVLKAHQGKGYGRALYELVHNEAKATGSLMVLKAVADVDVNIYTKLGFRVLASCEFGDWRTCHREVYKMRLMVNDKHSRTE
ncbi:hypothetical protein CPB83DRAFT_853156 [Crepidotus variabilis]|uniref:N-acetyltransferase domain-containing protein n=1 Tax=Crepidotus variabilis TaxID=179855 RepID=A0A9P6EHC8_9AGAR|nr:hypothetical protein CPB83DRAFT_853156 [Crepidotus variabilis]